MSSLARCGIERSEKILILKGFMVFFNTRFLFSVQQKVHSILIYIAFGYKKHCLDKNTYIYKYMCVSS